MAKDKIEEELKNIICEYADVNKEDLTSDMSFTYDIGIDSFGLISLLSNIEDSFNIKIPDYDLVNFQTMSDVVDYISCAVTD